MKTAANVSADLAGWLASGLLKSEVIVKLAEDCLGWPYIFGAVGEKCTPAVRKKYYNNYLTRNPDEAKQIKKKCRVLNGSAESCSGCPFYPGCPVRSFDCRGFTRWILGQVGITLKGAGATSQWNNPLNWDYKGTIDQYDGKSVAVFFQRSTIKANTMAHTGLLIGGGEIIHCSGTVKKEALYKEITHFAIPKGLEGGYTPMPTTTKPTLRKGSRGEYVTLLQTQLIQQGYSVGSTGADGIFGSDTLYAVKKFQLDHGLQMDGIVGQATWKALMNPVEMALYTVHIPKQPKYAAEALVKEYQDAWMEEEE